MPKARRTTPMLGVILAGIIGFTAGCYQISGSQHYFGSGNVDAGANDTNCGYTHQTVVISPMTINGRPDTGHVRVSSSFPFPVEVRPVSASLNHFGGEEVDLNPGQVIDLPFEIMLTSGIEIQVPPQYVNDKFVGCVLHLFGKTVQQTEIDQ